MWTHPVLIHTSKDNVCGCGGSSMVCLRNVYMFLTLSINHGTKSQLSHSCLIWFKEILWLRSSKKPALYQDFFPTHADFLRKCISNHDETKQSSKFQSDPSPNCFTINIWNKNCWLSTVYFLLSYCFLYLIFTQVL